MIIPDVNVLVAVFRADAPHHDEASRWLRGLPPKEVLAVPAATLVRCVRIVTHPKVFPTPSPPALALAFADRMRAHPAYVDLPTGPDHWVAFRRLVLEHDLTGNDVPDAHLAALAIANDATLVTYDTGFSRFGGLRTATPR